MGDCGAADPRGSGKAQTCLMGLLLLKALADPDRAAGEDRRVDAAIRMTIGLGDGSRNLQVAASRGRIDIRRSATPNSALDLEPKAIRAGQNPTEQVEFREWGETLEVDIAAESQRIDTDA